jgi:putative phosphoribosyl transferase
MMGYNPTFFKDRIDAGRRLGERLLELKLQDPVVLAVPSGGVPVAREVATTLRAPLDLIIARKIQFPWTTEAGFGAVVADGTVFLGPYAERLPSAVVEAQTRKARREVEQRTQEFLRGRKPVDVAGKAAILVDDGLASGSTMLAVVQAVRKSAPKEIIVAAPTASGTAVELLEAQVDRLVVLYVHPVQLPFAVASSYEKWHDLSDEEVLAYLEGASGLNHCGTE